MYIFVAMCYASETQSLLSLDQKYMNYEGLLFKGLKQYQMKEKVKLDSNGRTAVMDLKRTYNIKFCSKSSKPSIRPWL